LAAEALPKVKAPTLLIVGGLDEAVLQLNEKSFASLRCEKALKIVPGATHLFEERGALESVAHLAATWFLAHLSRGPKLIESGIFHRSEPTNNSNDNRTIH
jgi:alpha-beta hydrolase superfamily lysophospholipase